LGSINGSVVKGHLLTIYQDREVFDCATIDKIR